MILKQITDIKIEMLQLDPEDLIIKLNKIDPELEVKNNNDRTLNIKAKDDIHLHDKNIDKAILKWINRDVDISIPIKMMYSIYPIDIHNYVIKV